MVYSYYFTRYKGKRTVILFCSVLFSNWQMVKCFFFLMQLLFPIKIRMQGSVKTIWQFYKCASKSFSSLRHKTMKRHLVGDKAPL